MHLAFWAHLWVAILYITSSVICGNTTLVNTTLLPNTISTTLGPGFSGLERTTMAPTQSFKAPNDSEDCLLAWLSLISSWIHTPVTIWPCSTYTYKITTTSTLTKPISSECDGFPRATVTGETVITSSLARAHESYCHYSTSEYTYHYPKSVPSCRIAPPYCEEQWSRFKAAVKGDAYALWQGIANPFDNQWDAQAYWRKDLVAQISEWNEHLFENCQDILPYLRQSCISGYAEDSEILGVPAQNLHLQLEKANPAKVEVERFVLLHFPPEKPKFRDLCTNSGYGQFFDYFYRETSDTKLDLPATATVTAIMFEAHDFRISEQVILTPNPVASIWSGNWVFTSPSIYLALNTMRVKRTCLPAKTYTNRILTLHPHNLTSLVGAYTIMGAPTEVFDPDIMFKATSLLPRRFNFADLNGPIPASAYFVAFNSTAYPFNGQYIRTIVEGNHWPTISLPPEITNIDPQLFATVNVSFGTSPYVKEFNVTFANQHPGVWDPPVTLQAISRSLPADPMSTAYPRAGLGIPTMTDPPISSPSPLNSGMYDAVADFNIQTEDNVHDPAQSKQNPLPPNNNQDAAEPEMPDEFRHDENSGEQGDGDGNAHSESNPTRTRVDSSESNEVLDLEDSSFVGHGGANPGMQARPTSLHSNLLTSNIRSSDKAQGRTRPSPIRPAPVEPSMDEIPVGTLTENEEGTDGEAGPSQTQIEGDESDSNQRLQESSDSNVGIATKSPKKVSAGVINSEIRWHWSHTLSIAALTLIWR